MSRRQTEALYLILEVGPHDDEYEDALSRVEIAKAAVLNALESTSTEREQLIAWMKTQLK